MLNKVKILNCLLLLLVYIGSLYIFHQAPQLENESGFEGEEDIEDSQELLNFILGLKILSNFLRKIHFYTTFMEATLL